MLPLLAAAAALFLLSSSSSSRASVPSSTGKPKPLPAPMPRIVPKAKPLASTKPGGKAPPPKYNVKIGPAKILPAKPKPKATAASNLAAPLAAPASQGGSPMMAAPLSADIQSDTLQRPAQTPRSLPTGFNPAAARSSSRATANHLRNKGKVNYDRRLLKQWQTHAGLTSDGLYGGATRGALIYFGVSDPPAPFTADKTTKAYKPPA